MPNGGGLVGRVTGLELRMAEAEASAAGARDLAAGADRAVGDLKGKVLGHERSIQALHSDLSDIRREMHGGFAQMRAGFVEVDVKFGQIRAGMRLIVDRLDRLIGDA